MKRSTIIIIASIFILIIAVIVIVFSFGRSSTKSLTLKKVKIDSADQLVAVRDGSLYYIRNQKLYEFKNNQNNLLQSKISNFDFTNNNNFLQYSTATDGIKINTIAATSYLKDFSNNKLQSYQDTLRTLYCNGKFYYVKPSGYFSSYVQNSSGKTVLPSGFYETLFCLGDIFYFTQGEGADSTKLVGININSQKTIQTDINIGGKISDIFYNDEYFYFADSTKIFTYDSRLQKTETEAYGIKPALAANSNKTIYYVQPAVQINGPRDNQYTDTMIMKFDLNSKKTSTVAKLILSKENELVMKSTDTFDSKFKQVLYDESNKIFYILFQDKVYEVKS